MHINSMMSLGLISSGEPFQKNTTFFFIDYGPINKSQ